MNLLIEARRSLFEFKNKRSNIDQLAQAGTCKKRWN